VERKCRVKELEKAGKEKGRRVGKKVWIFWKETLIGQSANPI